MADNLTPEQISEYKDAFALFDKDRDGTISIDELADVMRVLGSTPTKALLKQILDEVDTDKSGRIEFEEFLALMVKPQFDDSGARVDNEEDEILTAFKVFDKDGSGSISESELRAVMKALGQTLNEDELQQMLEEADDDNSGQISYEEFRKIITSK